MYKADFVNGDKWFEWIKLSPSNYSVYRINGDGSHTVLDNFKLKSVAKKYCHFLNDNYATEDGLLKVFRLSDGKEFLGRQRYIVMNQDDDGFPLCPVYKEKVLPDENDRCSLCRTHSASVTANGQWASLDTLKDMEIIPF